jgi:hypothetical protein
MKPDTIRLKMEKVTSMKFIAKLAGALLSCAALISCTARIPLQVQATPGYTRLTVLLTDEMSTLEAHRHLHDGQDALSELMYELRGMTPLIDLAKTHDEEELNALRRHRLTRYYEVDISSLSQEQAKALLAQVRTNPVVEAADFEPLVDGMETDIGKVIAQTERTDIPDYMPQQNYLQGKAAVSPYRIGGVNAVAAWNVPGGKGEAVRVISSEGDHWAYDHIDLPRPYFEILGGGKTGAHDTSSAGVIASQGNGFGTTGISPAVRLGYVKYGVDNFREAASHLQAGDVLQIGVHYLYNNGQLNPIGCTSNCYMPVEYYGPIRDLITYFTMEKGVHVVLAAANGNINLDHPFFNRYFDRSSFDSGSIYAGAVDPDTGIKRPASEYGSRVDLFSWGAKVTTTDWSVSNPTTGYTHTFNGTSSANPIIAGVVASLQGVARARGLGDIPPKALRKILVETGYPESSANR